MKSIFYMYPWLYDWGIRFLYFDGMKILKNIIGRNKSVFEPACGYGRMKKYIYSDCTYAGVDLNDTFIEYGQKKKRNIKKGNALDRSVFQKADTILVCDILHHLKIPDMHKLISLAIEFALEKVVIIEPIFVNIAAKNNPISRFIGKIMKVIDADGVNEIERWLSLKEYNELFESFHQMEGVKDMTVRNFRNHDFVVLTV